MRRQKTHGFWPLVVSVLVVGLGLIYAQPASGWGGHHHHGFHLGFHHYYYPHGFYSYGYPGYPYEPYYYEPYYPGEHRRFPAFRLPAFFRYPGALGKDEGSKQETRAISGNATAQEIQRKAPR